MSATGWSESRCKTRRWNFKKKTKQLFRTIRMTQGGGKEESVLGERVTEESTEKNSSYNAPPGPKLMRLQRLRRSERGGRVKGGIPRTLFQFWVRRRKETKLWTTNPGSTEFGNWRLNVNHLSNWGLEGMGAKMHLSPRIYSEFLGTGRHKSKLPEEKKSRTKGTTNEVEHEYKERKSDLPDINKGCSH